MEFYQQIEELTKAFVAVRSVNGSAGGEAAAADFLEKTLRAIPHFQNHPETVWRQALQGDALGRSNVFALLQGTKHKSAKTLLWHGHMDTVGTDDFGTLEPWALEPDKLLEQVLAMDIPVDMREELASGDWMMGRGACDMKSGVCVFLVLLAYLSEHRECFAGQILFMSNPVEENQHLGAIQAVDTLRRLQKERGLSFALAINNDYICPLYPGDTKRYVYLGAAGKLLPCFYVRGQETHVGQCFEGFDAAAAAAAIVQRIHGRTEFSDGYAGEYTLPPSVLQLRDLKAAYNVQTVQEAAVYFNYFVHQESVVSILQRLKRAAEEALAGMADRQEGEQRAYAERQHGISMAARKRFRVYTFAELEQAVGARIPAGERQALAARLMRQHLDARETSIQYVRGLARYLPQGENAVVVFFAPPYCPYHTLRQEKPQEAALRGRFLQLVADFAAEEGEPYEVKSFFPSLSDSSYLKMDDGPEAVQVLAENFPLLAQLYPLPLQEIQALQIPAVNFGCYGRDAHKWSERVYKPYSFAVLPRLILKTVNTFLD